MYLVDYYAQELKRQNAHSMELASGSPVKLKLDAGDRVSQSAVGHSQIRQLVQEIAAAGDLEALEAGGRVRIDYAAVQLDVTAVEPQRWLVTLAPRAAVAVGRGARGAAVPATGSVAGTSGGASGGATATAPLPPREREARPAAAQPHADARPQPPQAQPQPQAQVQPQAPSEPSSPPQAQAQSQPQSEAQPQPEAQPQGDDPAPAASADLRVSADEPRINHHLRRMIEVGASDLHMSSTAPPLVRLGGEMKPLFDDTPLSSEQLAELLMEILPDDLHREFREEWDVDFAHAIPGVARFRANYFIDRHGVGAVFRQIPFEILTPDTLGLPKEVLDLCWLSKGLVLVTGPTGSGKSTTLASLIDFINANRSDHIITIEDPIEFVHQNKRCLVNQREVGSHTKSFKKALRAALREDPDIVLVGELRDLETIAIAVETAETGHLVFGTLHTTTAPSTVDRIIDQFPGEQQAQIRMMLADSLKGVIAQVLCKKQGGGRAAAYEILLANSAISNLIREGKTFQLPSAMQTGRKQGMRTMNDSLLQLVLDGKVDPKEAYVKAVDKQGLRMMLEQKGVKLELDAGAA